MKFTAVVEITGREGIADPQGLTIERALPALGFDGIEQVHVGKLIRFVLEAPDESAARARVTSMCDRLLANPVIEQAAIRLETAAAAGSSAAAASDAPAAPA